ncbi:MAG: glycosyltransferase family 2 protein [Clostridia bacterium]|nr:glycosyltransferase family 2 protein [Clostridia bacterium]
MNKDLKVSVILSTMHKTNADVVSESNIKCDTVVVNQCDCEKETEVKNGNITFISSPDRGLSKSRNLAIKKSDADILVVSDDDEEFSDGFYEEIKKAYGLLPKADVIIFDVHGRPRNFGDKPKKLSKLQLLKVCSVRITFKSEKIKDKIFFDERLGAGTENGAGEENKFLFDCYRKGLKIYHYPYYIAKLKESESSWFKGYDEKYFYNRGMTTRYTMGFFLSFLYAFYYSFAKRKLHKGQMSVIKSLKYTLKGIFENKLNKKK